MKYICSLFYCLFSLSIASLPTLNYADSTPSAATTNTNFTSDYFAQPQANKNDTQCKNIIHQIQSDVSTYPNQTSSLPWMNITWLKNQLGPAQTATAYDYVYMWKNFNLFVGADGSLAKSGTLPNHIQPKSYEDVVSLLGQPSQTYSEKLNVYSWTCAGNGDSFITVLTRTDSIPTRILGKDCTDSQCKTFFSASSESDIKQKFDQHTKQQAEVSAQILSARLKNYNDYFKTSLQNQAQLSADITAKIKNYYANLRECKPGIYQYAVPVLQDYLYQTSVINSLKENRCLVNTSYNIPHIGKVDLKCKIPLEDLNLFSETEAESIAQGFSTFDSEHPGTLQQLTDKECKRYIGGVL